MGDFWTSIEDELDSIAKAEGAPGPFGADYNTNAAVVKQVQGAINALGYTPALAVDGSYGPNTAAGIKWLQGQKGLTVDGVIGDQTLGALGISPPGGLSVDSVTGAVKGGASSAAGIIANLQQQFSALVNWSTKNPQPITQGSGVAPGFSATKASVVNSYVDWTTPLEGFLPWMYIDALGYVTTGMGNLIDPIGTALGLPWKNADGSAASQAQIQAAWNAVDAQRSDPKGTKQTSGAATRGGGSQGGVTSIRITKEDVQQLVASKMKQNESFLTEGLTNFAQAPADAQMAAHSMAWAMGPGFAKTWTQFRNAFNSGDYKTAAAQSHMQGVGIDMRNMANNLLLSNAAQVVAGKKDPDTLYYLDFNSLYGAGLISPAAIIADALAHPVRTAAIVGGGLAGLGLLIWGLTRGGGA